MNVWNFRGLNRPGSIVAVQGRAEAARLLRCDDEGQAGLITGPFTPAEQIALRHPGVVYSKANDFAEYLAE
jgi:hypothetical protein